MGDAQPMPRSCGRILNLRVPAYEGLGGFLVAALTAVLLLAPVHYCWSATPDGQYIQDWLLAGPFTERHLWLIQAANVLGSKALVPEEGHPALPLMKNLPKWMRHHSVGSQVNLIEAFGQHERAGALAFTTIRAKTAGAAKFCLGSDDQVRVWVNDKLVHRYDEGRPLWPDEDCFTADLQAGENRCLVFVAQGTGNWGFTLRVVAGEDPGPAPVVWDVADIKGQERELYSPHWRYFAGDSADFADPDFDDSTWPPMPPDVIVPNVKGESVVWFRTRVWCTRALVNLPCVLYATDVGETEIFLDGNLIRSADGDSAAEADFDQSDGLSPPIPFMFTGQQQVLAVRLTRHLELQEKDQFRFQLKMKATQIASGFSTDDFREFAEDLRLDMSQHLHRLVLLSLLLLFLVFHGALLCYYPRRQANLLFCVTLLLALVTLGILHAQESVEDTRLSTSLYWVFLAMVPVCMLSGLALTHALWRDEVPRRKLLLCGFLAVALYLTALTRGERTFAFVVLPLSTIEFFRLYLVSAWRKFAGSWIFGVGLVCFAAAQTVNVAHNLLPLPSPSTGLITYFWVYGLVALLACVSVYIAREFAAATRKLEDLTATLESRVLDRTRDLNAEVQERQQAEQQIHELSQRLLTAQEMERERIARDLHDSVAQDLWSLRITCERSLQPSPNADEPARKLAAEVTERIQAAIHAVRTLAYGLRPPELDRLGLVAAVRRYCHDFAHEAGIPVDFHAAGMDNVSFARDIEINAFRLIQESLTNIRQHAEASHASVRLVASFPKIILRVEDDGKGFQMETGPAAAEKKRMGIRGMKERVNLLGGTMQTDSSPSAGTRIVIEIPWRERNDGGEDDSWK